MNYNVIATPLFQKQAKRLSNKYPSLKKELEEFGKHLAVNPHEGISLGNNAYKVRLAVKSKGRGKSGGLRIITYVVLQDSDVYLLSIYDKSEIENINDKTLQLMINSII